MNGPCGGAGPAVAEAKNEDFYTRTTRASNADASAAVVYLVVLGAIGAFAVTQFCRDTRRVLAPRRRQPWDDL